MNADVTRRMAVGGLLAAASVPAWSAMPPRFVPSAMAADVALLRRAYELLHPGLLRYQTAAESARRSDALAAAVARPISPAAFYLLLSRHLATVRCGHSYANFYNQTKAVQQALFDDQPRLPLQFLWLGTRMVVTADPFGTGVVPGSEVLAIDGRPAAEVLAALMPLARADGHNDAKRRRLLSVQGEDGFESFDVFYALTLGGGARFRLVVRGPDGRRRSAVVPAATLAQRQAQRGPLIDASGDTPQWTTERRGEAAVLTMPGWGLYNSKWDWRGWLDAQVDRLIADRVPRLIVDIRRNEGGEDCGDALVARLTQRPVTASPARRLPDDLKPYCDTWDRRFDTLGGGGDAVRLALPGTGRGGGRDRNPAEGVALHRQGGGADRPAEQLGHVSVCRDDGARAAGDADRGADGRQPARDQRRRLLLPAAARNGDRGRPAADRHLPAHGPAGRGDRVRRRGAADRRGDRCGRRPGNGAGTGVALALGGQRGAGGGTDAELERGTWRCGSRIIWSRTSTSPPTR